MTPPRSSTRTARRADAFNPSCCAAATPVCMIFDIHATTLLLAGTQVHVVAARLGHADPSITLRVYAHVISTQLAEAADIFARVMKAAS